MLKYHNKVIVDKPTQEIKGNQKKDLISSKEGGNNTRKRGSDNVIRKQKAI